MTCQDCIHYTDEIINDKYHLCDAYLSIGGSDRQDAWCVPSDQNACKLFVNRKSACDDCIYTYPDCPDGEYDKEDDEVLDLTQCSIKWCAYQTTKVDESWESVSK